MTVSTTANRVSYAADTTSTVFAVPFPFILASDLKVYVSGALVSSGYAVAGAGKNAGTVTFLSPPNASVVIVRQPDLLQQTSLPLNGPFPSKAVEQMVDKVVMEMQAVADIASRSLQLPPGEIGTLPQLPSAASRANMLLSFDSAGNPIASAPVAGTATALALALASSSGAGQIGFLQVGLGAVVRTILSRLLDTFSITDYGVKGDWNGTTGTDNTTNAQTILARSEQLAKITEIPRGDYLSGPLTLGDPATVGNYTPSGQLPGVFSLIGKGRDITRFYASAACSGQSFLKRENLAGVTIKGFTADGRGIADTCIDLPFKYGFPSAPFAPSAQSIIDELTAISGKIVGLNLNGQHDVASRAIRSLGSPIGLTHQGGGGQLAAAQYAISGLWILSAQNYTIHQSVALSGIDINGNTDNYVGIDGTQVFPIQPSVSIPSNRWGYALSAIDAGTYGAKVLFTNGFIFGGNTGAITGKFNRLEVRNSVVDYSLGAKMFFNTTSGQAGKFVFKMVGGEIRQAAGNCITDPPANARVVLDDVLVAGVRYVDYDSERVKQYAVSLGSSGNLLGTGNTYSRNIVYSTRMNGDVFWVDGDIILASLGPGHSGNIILKGFLASASGVITGSLPVNLHALVPFTGGRNTLSLEMSASSDAMDIFQSGGGSNPDGINVSTIGPGFRLRFSGMYRANPFQ